MELRSTVRGSKSSGRLINAGFNSGFDSSVTL